VEWVDFGSQPDADALLVAITDTAHNSDDDTRTHMQTRALARTFVSFSIFVKFLVSSSDADWARETPNAAYISKATSSGIGSALTSAASGLDSTTFFVFLVEATACGGEVACKKQSVVTRSFMSRALQGK
jgi:hypothetical protein